MRRDENQSKRKRLEAKRDYPQLDEDISPIVLNPRSANNQRIQHPEASQRTTNIPRRSIPSQSPILAKASTKKRPRKNKIWSHAVVVLGVIGSIASIIGLLPLFGIPTIWSLPSHPATASPIATETPTSITNICETGNNENVMPNSVGSTYCIYRGHEGPVHAVAWSPDGYRIASAGADGTVQIWDAITGENVITYRGHKGSVNAVAWSPDGYHIASGGDDGTVQVWLFDTASLAYTFGEGCGNPAVTALAWSPNGQFIALGRKDGVVTSFPADGTFFHAEGCTTNKSYSSSVTALAWSPDSNSLASASDDGTVKIDSSNTPNHEKTFPKPNFTEYNVTALAWSPNGKSLAYGYFAGGNMGLGFVEVWSVAQGNEVNPVFDSVYTNFTPPIFIVNSLAWACNSNYLAVGDSVGNVAILDISSQKEIYVYTNHAKRVNAVAWSLDGTKIASGSDDGTVKVWQASRNIKCNT